jgi:pimeloyl-ACP methyl ester carboxylesterase
VPFAPRPRFIKPFMPGLSRLVMVRNFGKKMFYDPSTVDPEAIRAVYLAAARVKGSMDTVWNMWTDVPKDEPIEYDRIDQPVLVLAAEKERVIPLYGRALAYLRKKLPQARILTVERTGHLMLEERPDAVNRLIRDFISETIAASQAPEAATTAA